MNLPQEKPGFDDLFASETAPAENHATPWKVMVVDDDEDIHAVLHLALQGIEVAGRPLNIFDCPSAAKARGCLAAHPDMALALLDVVMETEQAGLSLVRHIREERRNSLLQILLITGQPGYAPQREVVQNYEINGYHLKSDLTADKLFASVHAALRAYKAMADLEAQRREILEQKAALEDHQNSLAHYQQHLEELVARRTAEVENSTRHLAETQFAMDRAGIAIGWNDTDTGRFLSVNDEACRQLGFTREELLTLSISDVNPEFSRETVHTLAQALRQGDGSRTIRTTHRRRDGSRYPVTVTAYLHRSAGQECFIAFFTDVTEQQKSEEDARLRMEELHRSNAALEEANKRLTQAQVQLLQSEKLAAIGLLAAGVAHEINNPVGYVSSNLHSLARYLDHFLAILAAYETAARQPEHEHLFAEVHRLEEATSFAYEKEDILALLAESESGLEQVTRIIRDLKDFARSDNQDTWLTEDIHQGIESTLNVIWNQLKYTCEVRKDYGDLPPVECILPQLNQVFMNLLVNAGQAIETQGVITIRTRACAHEVCVEISDTGKGISPEHLTRIFDPFFTTKPMGKGTGLGLAVSYNIVEKHHGRIEVESTPGKGTCFRIWLPLNQPKLEST